MFQLLTLGLGPYVFTKVQRLVLCLRFTRWLFETLHCYKGAKVINMGVTKA